MFTPELFTEKDDVKGLKLKFAEALLRSPENAFTAALQVFGSDTGRAIFVSTTWINDPIVLSEQSRLLQSKGAQAFLPTKDAYAREVWKQATNERTPIEDRTRLLALYGDVMGFKEAPTKNTGGITVNNNKVMIVRDFGTDENWEARAAAQQHKLTIESDATIIK